MGLPIQKSHAAMQSNPTKVHTENEIKKMFRVLRKCKGNLRLMKM